MTFNRGSIPSRPSATGTRVLYLVRCKHASSDLLGPSVAYSRTPARLGPLEVPRDLTVGPFASKLSHIEEIDE